MHLLSVFSLRNRALIALITIVVGVFGGIALTTLKQELIPSVSFPQLVVVTSYPGASPDVVETDVSTPIETAIQGVAGLNSTNATSSSGLSSISASFDYGTDITSAEQKVQLAINRIGSQLPAAVDPQVITGTIDDLPVIQIAVTSDLDAEDLTARLQESTLTDLEQLDDVREASLLGTTAQRVTITPDLDALAEKGLTTQAIRDALDANGTLLAAGTITEDDSTLTVQAGERVTSTDDIAALPLLGGSAPQPTDPTALLDPTAAATVGPTTIGDVADVAIGTDPVTGISRVNGKDSLTIAVTKTPAGNTVEVSHAVTEALPGLQKALGNGTEFTVVFDQAPFIEQSIESLATEGLLGLGFAVIVILVFLLSIRSTLVTAISIPVSVLITFIAMLASGYSLNILTLGALTIAIGRVVDDSIVVIENIKRHIGLGEPKLDAIRTAVREVATAVTASTVTTVAVFLPLALVSDITGELFRPFALTVTIALVASLFVSLTIVPVLAYWFLGSKPAGSKKADVVAAGSAKRGRKHAGGSAAENPVTDDTRPIATDAAASGSAAPGTVLASSSVSAPTAVPASAEGPSGSARAATTVGEPDDELDRPSRLQRLYLPIIRLTLARPVVTILVSLLILAGSGALATRLQTNFIGDSGQNTLTVTQTLESGTSLEATDTAATKVEKALRDVSGVETVQTSIGSSGSSLASAFGGGGDVSFSITTDPDTDQAALQKRVRAAVADLDDVGDVALASAGSGFASSDIEVDIKATTPDDLQKAADDVLAAVKDLSVTAQAESNLSSTQPYLAIQVDRDKAAAAGLSEIAVGGIVTEAMLPAAVGSVVIDEKSLSIYIDNPTKPTTLDELKAFTIPTLTGPTPLSELATVTAEDGPSSITTQRGVRSATVTITPNGQDVGTASTAVQTAVDGLDLPDGATAELGGVTADQADAFSQLGLALLAAILIVYTVMVATFRSLLQPVLLLVSVPFAATGAIILQVVSGIPLGVPSLIGVLMLIGIVVTNAIVLVDLINQYRERGMLARDAILHGAARRLRPILMTALATIFALLPMAIGLTGGGGFISQPLAIVVIGGLVSSTVLTLIVLPTLYYLVFGWRERREARRAARAGGLPGDGRGTGTGTGTGSASGRGSGSRPTAPPEHHFTVTP